MKKEFAIAEQRIEDLTAWYIDVITEAARLAGGRVALGKKLGRDKSYVTVTLARGDFGALRECVRRIVEKNLI